MATIVVTGASQGIGQAVAEAFAEEEGARLALVSRNEGRLKVVADNCRARGAEAEVFPCDVTDDEAVKELAHDVVGRLGVPDVLVNNAGSFEPGLIEDTPPMVFREQIESNLISAFVVSRYFLKGMIARGRGHIFFLGSVASIMAYPSGAAYCAAKHGVLGLARALREETKDKGIRVTTLLPGATDTPSWEGSNHPASRFMPPADVARTILYAYHLSHRSVVEEIVLRPQLGDI